MTAQNRVISKFLLAFLFILSLKLSISRVIFISEFSVSFDAARRLMSEWSERVILLPALITTASRKMSCRAGRVGSKRFLSFSNSAVIFMNSHSVGLRIAEANFAAVSSAFFLSSSDISSLSAPRSKRVTLDMIVSSIAAEESHTPVAPQ